MRVRPLAVAIGATLLGVGAIAWCADSLAADVVVDDSQNGADFAPALRVKSGEPAREDRTTYDHQELMCETFGDCSPPAPKGTTRPAHESKPQSGLSFQLRRPVTPAPPPVYSAIESAKIAEDVSKLDPVVVYGAPISPWSTDLSLSRVEKLLPCLGCKRTAKGLPAALHLGVDLMTSLLRGFFQQPHVRGEPNDEALYLAHDGCENDSIRCTTKPELP